jgi:hypothetical protein
MTATLFIKSLSSRSTLGGGGEIRLQNRQAPTGQRVGKISVGELANERGKTIRQSGGQNPTMRETAIGALISELEKIFSVFLRAK